MQFLLASPNFSELACTHSPVLIHTVQSSTEILWPCAKQARSSKGVCPSLRRMIFNSSVRFSKRKPRIAFVSNYSEIVLQSVNRSMQTELHSGGWVFPGRNHSWAEGLAGRPLLLRSGRGIGRRGDQIPWFCSFWPLLMLRSWMLFLAILHPWKWSAGWMHAELTPGAPPTESTRLHFIFQ